MRSRLRVVEIELDTRQNLDEDPQWKSFSKSIQHRVIGKWRDIGEPTVSKFTIHRWFDGVAGPGYARFEIVEAKVIQPKAVLAVAVIINYTAFRRKMMKTAVREID